MIEGNNIILTVNIVFITLSLFIFLFFFLKGFTSSLYDILAFGIIVLSIPLISSWLTSLIPLVSSADIQNGLMGMIVSRFANQIIWVVIIYIVLSILFLIIKKPLLKKIPLKLDRKLDKGLSMILSGIAIFLFGTLMTGIFLSPVFANGAEIVNQSVLVVFKQSGQQLVDDVGENVGELSIISRLMEGYSLTLDDQQAIIDLFVSIQLPEDVATTLSKFALQLETSEEEIKVLVDYAQNQGLTLEDLSQLLRDLGLSQEIIDGFLKDFE